LGSTLLLGLSLTAPVTAKTVVTYPQQESANGYPVQVLRLALREAGVDFELKPSATPMLQGRALEQLAKGKDVNVVWSMTSQARESSLRPIRIPIDKGLLGWRLILTSKAGAAALAKVKSIDELRRLQAGQGHDWPDTNILRFNGLQVQTGTSYEGLFKMLSAGRFDYFPRSILEIWDEQKAFGLQDLEIEKNLILYYPTAFYFFVSRQDRQLASTIETGLNKAIENGKFEQLFQQTYGDILQRAHLKSRIRFNLQNPLLPAATPLGRKELWLAF
jgi:hypothetical protein